LGYSQPLAFDALARKAREVLDSEEPMSRATISNRVSQAAAKEPSMTPQFHDLHESQRRFRRIPLLPVKRLRLARLFAPLAVMLLLTALAQAQKGHVTLKGSVSETVALSVLPNSTEGDIDPDVVSNGNTVRIILSGHLSQAAVIRVPLLVRSNGGFRISAAVESKTAVLTQLSIIDVRATGTLVSKLAVTELNVLPQFDFRGLDKSASSAPTLLDVSRPFVIASGPRVSLGGTLQAPNNALRITLLIRVRSEQGPLSFLQVTLTGAAEPRIQ
jgi:hypothetical protein